VADHLSFGKSSRLLNAADYGAVFDDVKWKVSSKEILCLSRNNGLDRPRLGLVIAKKNIRLAVQRNRVKRIIRESFRLHQHQLPAIDMILLARAGLGEFSNTQLHDEISKIWIRLIKKIDQDTSDVKRNDA
jgi:ribonuclease P protein component